MHVGETRGKAERGCGQRCAKASFPGARGAPSAFHAALRSPASLCSRLCLSGQPGSETSLGEGRVHTLQDPPAFSLPSSPRDTEHPWLPSTHVPTTL